MTIISLLSFFPYTKQLLNGKIHVVSTAALIMLCLLFDNCYILPFYLFSIETK